MGLLSRIQGKIAIHTADIKNLMINGTAIAADAADLNAPRIAKMAVVLTAGTYTVKTLPANSVLEQVILQVSAAFDGTLQLGKTGAVDAYVTDANFVKTIRRIAAALFPSGGDVAARATTPKPGIGH